MRRPPAPRLSSKYVPYLRMSTAPAAREFLPAGPDSVLTVDMVRRFRKVARRDSGTSMVVLGTLRAHSVNGAEAPLAAGAVLFAALAFCIGTTIGEFSVWAWVIWLVSAGVVVGTAVHIVRISFAAHARRVVAITWLGAYEDALRR